MPAQSSKSLDVAYRLSFLSGKLAGADFILPYGETVVVGRAPTAEVVIADSMMSRSHARLSYRPDGALVIKDLSSANGTFVNGERVDEVHLIDGDRVLLGANILRIERISHDSVVASSRRGMVSDRPFLDEPTLRREPTFQGDLSGTSVAAVLRQLGRSKDAEVSIFDDGTVLNIVVEGGDIVDCTASDLDLAPKKALYRALGLQSGRYEVHLLGEPRAGRTALPLASTVVEGMFSVDEFVVLVQKLPSLEQKLSLMLPLGPPLSHLDPPELDVLQVAINSVSIQAAIDASEMVDADVTRTLLRLIELQYLRTS